MHCIYPVGTNDFICSNGCTMEMVIYEQRDSISARGVDDGREKDGLTLFHPEWLLLLLSLLMMMIMMRRELLNNVIQNPTTLTHAHIMAVARKHIVHQSKCSRDVGIAVRSF